jgi:D-sedoheptulose 7-phosphate isomerase
MLIPLTKGLIVNTDALFDAEMAEHAAVAAKTTAALRGDFTRLVGAAVRAVRAGNKILLFGNGGSASDAQHLATELVVRFKRDRAPIAAIALTTDTSALTAIGNDLGFDQLFARQVEALGRPGDLAIGISTSGNSPNVLLALKAARTMGLVAAGLAGRDGGEMNRLADPLLTVPSDVTARIQEMHITLGHMLCGALEQELGLV